VLGIALTKRKRRIPPPLFQTHLHFSLSADQVSSLEDCLFFTASEANPEPFRKKALELIRHIRSNSRYSELVFEGEKSGGDCGCD
jgi:hypothetical protein